MADSWVRLGMAVVAIALVSVCLYAGSDRSRMAEPPAIGLVTWR